MNKNLTAFLASTAIMFSTANLEAAKQNTQVKKAVTNKKKNPKFVWLTNTRAFGRFMSAPFKKRNIFK